VLGADFEKERSAMELVRSLIREARVRLSSLLGRLRGSRTKPFEVGVETPEARRRFWTEFREGQREADVRVSRPR
jgi:hypothetical protein